MRKMFSFINFLVALPASLKISPKVNRPKPKASNSIYMRNSFKILGNVRMFRYLNWHRIQVLQLSTICCCIIRELWRRKQCFRVIKFNCLGLSRVARQSVRERKLDHQLYDTDGLLRIVQEILREKDGPVINFSPLSVT